MLYLHSFKHFNSANLSSYRHCATIIKNVTNLRQRVDVDKDQRPSFFLLSTLLGTTLTIHQCLINYAHGVHVPIYAII